MTPTRSWRGRGQARPTRAWRVIDLGPCEPVRAVAFAEAVAPFVARGDSPNTLLFARPTVPCISIGFHLSADDEVDPTFVRRRRLPVLRRVEGGGTVYLDPDQLFYQFVYAGFGENRGGPPDFSRFLSAPVDALQMLGLDAELRPPSDIVVRGRKLSGNAGGEWERAFLITGDILGRADLRAMADCLRLPHPAIRRLLRREMARRMTSWERETGKEPDWLRLKRAFVEAFRKLGLGSLEAGDPTEDEEARFLSETLPRHQDPAWRLRAAPPRPLGHPLRRVRVAGPHGLLVFDDSTGTGFQVAVVEGSKLIEAYRMGAGVDTELTPVEPGTPRWTTLARRLRAVGGFG